MNNSYFRILLLSMAVMFCLIACKKENTPDTEPETPTDTPTDVPSENPGGEQYPEYVPFEIVDGKARFYVYDTSIRNACGTPVTDWSSCTIKVGDGTYKATVDADGKPYVDVPVSQDGTYNAVLLSDASAAHLQGTSDYTGILHPFAWASHTIGTALSALPLYASYSEALGGQLRFTTGQAVLKLVIKGAESISSVKVTSPSGAFIAGKGDYASASRSLSYTEGVSFSVLNCTAKGNFVPLTESGTAFFIPVAAGSYPDGLDVSVCSSDHKMYALRIPAFSVASDEIHPYEMVYNPESDLLFYEGFDNFVWGGDIIGGSSTFALSPNVNEITATSNRTLSGYETATSLVPYDRPGTGFIQPDGLSSVMGKTVAEARQMSSSYVKSRNIGSWLYMYRCQEYQGCISIGTADSWNGIFEAPFPSDIITSHRDVTVSFDYCPQTGLDDDIVLTATNGANIVSCTIDGKTLAADKVSRRFVQTSSECVIAQDAVTVPVDMASPKTWHHVELTVKNMNVMSGLKLTTASSKAGNHGLYLDNFQVRTLKNHKKTQFTKTLRVLYWNIQNGMWADQQNSYDNFVTFVKKYSPDVCVWCESESIFKSGSDTKLSGSERYLPTGWPTLASRYGHDYTSRGGDNDNYSQTITSKYPITLIDAIKGDASKPVSHGAGLFSIDCGGNTYRFMSIHTWPQNYSYEYRNSSADEQNASKAANGGDYYREYEIKYLCDNYVKNYQNGNLLIMGDFNAKSPVDNHYYGLASDNTKFLANAYILNNTQMKDIIAGQYPGDFYASTQSGTERIDFMYASPAMYKNVSNATFIIDDWTVLSRYSAITTSYFCTPSDHRPLLVDFTLE